MSALETDNYWRGYDAAIADISIKSFEECRDAFNIQFPHDWKPESMAIWHYSKGYVDALLASMPR